mgnify:FL=1
MSIVVSDLSERLDTLTKLVLAEPVARIGHSRVNVRPLKLRGKAFFQLEYQQGQIVSKTLAQNRALSMTLFAFEQDEEISTHTADGDALVTVLDGTGRFTIDGEAHLVSAGESIVMPAHVPHAVYGQTRFKMLLTVIV